MIIFGWGRGRPTDKGAVAPAKCPNCQNDVMFRYIVSRRMFSLFFIPLIPFSPKHFVLCPVCTRGIEVTGPRRDAAKRMVELTASHPANATDEESYRSAVQAFWRGESPQLASPAAPLPEPPAAPPPSRPASG